jgi:PAS domain S-box-containing protein
MGHLAKGEAGFVRRPSAAARYGVAVVSVVLFVTTKLLLAQTPIPQSPFLLLSAAVMVAAWFGGLGPGLLATALATAAGDYFFWSPFGSFTGPGLNALPLALFALQGVLISALAQALRSATTRAESSAREAKSHRAALQESERRFRALVQNSSDVITVVDAGGTITYVSPAVERVTGYPPEELVGKSVFDHVRPDDLEQGRSTFAEIWSQPGSTRPSSSGCRTRTAPGVTPNSSSTTCWTIRAWGAW